MTRDHGVAFAVILASALVVAWRLPGLRQDGTQQFQLRYVLGHDLTEFHAVTPDSVRLPRDGVVYVYADECPFCGMDHIRVRRAATIAHAPFFAAVSVGASDYREYWGDSSATMPDAFLRLARGGADSLHLPGVPLLIVVRNDTVRAAWAGRLSWNDRDIQHAIACRLGQGMSCVRLYVDDVVHGLASRVNAARTVARVAGMTPLKPGG